MSSRTDHEIIESLCDELAKLTTRVNKLEADQHNHRPKKCSHCDGKGEVLDNDEGREYVNKCRWCFGTGKTQMVY